MQFLHGTNLALVLFSISPQNQESSDGGEHNLYNGESERFVQGSFEYGPNNNATMSYGANY